jgi:hypothetical protein
VRVWDELTLEQCAVMTLAMEETYLNGVIYYHSLLVHRMATGDAATAPPMSEAAVRSLIPHFVQVVVNLMERDWLEIREPHDGDPP